MARAQLAHNEFKSRQHVTMDRHAQLWRVGFWGSIMVVALAAVRCRMSLVRFALRVPTSHTTELTVIRHSDTPVTAVWTNRTVAVSGQTADL